MGVRARVSRCSLQRRPRRDGEEAHLGVDWLRAPLVLSWDPIGSMSSPQCGELILEEIQRKSRVREWTPQNAPRIRAGVTKKDQKAELKKNQTRRCYAEKTSIFFQTTGRHPPGARRETTEVKTRKC